MDTPSTLNALTNLDKANIELQRLQQPDAIVEEEEEQDRRQRVARQRVDAAQIEAFWAAYIQALAKQKPLLNQSQPSAAQPGQSALSLLTAQPQPHLSQ